MSLKNNSIFVFGALALSSLAYAEDLSDTKWQIKGKVRVDNVQSTSTTKDGSKDATTKKTSQIRLNRAQFEFVGKKETTEFRLKMYAEKNFLKYALVTKKLSDMISVSAGKLDARDFAWEWDYSSTDQYIFARAGAYGIESVPGAELKASLGEHTVFLQVLQGSNTYSTGDKVLEVTAESKGGLTTTLQYRGDLMDHMIQPIVTFASVRMASSKFSVTDGTTTTDYNYGNGYQTHLGLGVKVNAAGSTTDLEYDLVKRLKQKDDDTSKEGSVSSIVFQSRLPEMMAFTPYLKLAVDSDKKGAESNVGDISRTAYAVGAEYSLVKSIRVHGVLTAENKSTKNADLTDKKVSAMGFNLGVTASM